MPNNNHLQNMNNTENLQYTPTMNNNIEHFENQSPTTSGISIQDMPSNQYIQPVSQYAPSSQNSQVQASDGNIFKPESVQASIPQYMSQNLQQQNTDVITIPSTPTKQTTFEPKFNNIKTDNINTANIEIKKPFLKDVDIVGDTNKVTLNNFDANDDSFDYGGTDLATAFMAPLPPGVNPDIIDFNKSNNDNYNAKDYLPKQINDEWFETDFSLAKYQLNDDKLINTERYIIGINTVGQSLKNATYDIRGTIPNPKFIVSPWSNSTYEPDFNLKPLC